MQGDLYLYHMVRVGQYGSVRVMTPLAEPQPGDPRLQGREVVAVMTYQGEGSVQLGGHWVTYVKVRGVWWNLDTNVVNIVQQNPFDNQNNSAIDYIIIKINVD